MPKPKTSKSNFRAVAGGVVAAAVLGSITALGVTPDADAANGLSGTVGSHSVSGQANGLANGLGANGL